MRLPATALAVSFALFGSTAAPAGAAESELEASRRSANAAAAEVAAAQSELAVIELEAASVTTQAVETEARLAQLRGAVQAQAVDRFIHGGIGDGAVDLLLEGDDLGSALRAGALARSVTADTDAVLEEYRSASDDLVVARARLADLEGRQADAVAVLGARADAAGDELERQVRLDAERKQAEAEARRAAARQAEAEAAVRAEAARLDAEAARAASAAVAPTGPTRRAAGAGGAPAANPPATTASRSPQPTTTVAPPAPERAREAAPAPAPAPGGGFRCPVDGSRAFTNDWGQPRSGGRRHQGTDILSPRGTPVVASVGGSVKPHQSSLGGISYYLTGDDGNTYFGTHLDSLSGASGRVAAGTVLGYIGNSGNARGGPTHLHFEIHPGGGGPVNPYPTLAASC